MAILFTQIGFAQNKVEKYCKVTIKHFIKSNTEKMQVDYGDKSEFDNFLYQDSIIVSLEKVTTFSNGISALNYLVALGWKLVSIIPEPIFYTYEICKEFYFKKEFEKK